MRKKSYKGQKITSDNERLSIIYNRADNIIFIIEANKRHSKGLDQKDVDFILSEAYLITDLSQ